jgi:hypothetical protein
MAHNPEVAGSNPAPATKIEALFRTGRGPLACSLVMRYVDANQHAGVLLRRRRRRISRRLQLDPFVPAVQERGDHRADLVRAVQQDEMPPHLRPCAATPTGSVSPSPGDSRAVHRLVVPAQDQRLVPDRRQAAQAGPPGERGQPNAAARRLPGLDIFRPAASSGSVLIRPPNMAPALRASRSG